MKKKTVKNMRTIILAGIAVLVSVSVFAQTPLNQTQPLKVTQLTTVKSLSLSSFNKSLSPKYVSSTKKYLKANSKTNLSTNTGASAKSTVTLLKGGTEGRAPSQTTSTSPAKDGNHTCISRSVNEKSDFFYQPMFQQEEFIYPGAFFDARALINNQFGYYSLPSSYRRQPYRISANLFTMTGTPQNPTETIGDGAGEDYSLASFRAAKGLIMNRNANANPPVEAFVEYIQALTKEEVAIQLGYNVSANVPAELVALLTTVPVGVNASVNASVIASQVNEKSRLILKINYNFYSINASPTDDNSLNFTSPAPGSDIPNNVVFVSSVLYGTTGYVYFESDKSLSELQSTIEETIGAAGPVDVGSINVGISASARAKFASTVSKMVAYGKGLGVVPGSSLPVGSLDNLMALIGTLRSWGPNNQGSPIAYTMNFLNDGVQALVSYSTQFPNKICTQTPLTDLRFDLDLELDHIEVNNINSGMGSQEELYGKLEFTYLKAGSREVNTNQIYWSKEESESGTNAFKKGKRAVDVRKVIIKDLTFEELRNISLYVAGSLRDDEGIFASRGYACQECNEFDGNYGKRKMFFIEMPSTQSAINALKNNGDYQVLKFGDDEFFELNFFESGKKNEGWIKTMWKVWVKPHN
jgi:hypothetical protein